MLPSVVEMTRELVAIPSVSSIDPRLDRPNRPVVERVAAFAAAVGFKTEIVPVPDKDGKVNLIATLGEGPGGLVLSGHTDTVPWDEGAWRTDPFQATEEDGRLYGLGTADMKGFFGIALHAAARFAGRSLKEPLILLATADEECTMSGARALVAAGRPRARRAVIGEPTDLRPVRAHKGIFMERIRLLGRTGHSSDPANGVSALEGMHRVIDTLLELRAELGRRHRDESFAVPEPTMNLGRIEGGDAANRICGECTLDIDLRGVPGMDNAAVRAELRERVRRVVMGTGLLVEMQGAFDGCPPFSTPADASIVEVAAALTGEAPAAVMFGTEAPLLSQLGMQTIVLGAGSITVAHRPDEYLPLAQVAKATDVYAGLIERFCVEGG